MGIFTPNVSLSVFPIKKPARLPRASPLDERWVSNSPRSLPYLFAAVPPPSATLFGSSGGEAAKSYSNQSGVAEHAAHQGAKPRRDQVASFGLAAFPQIGGHWPEKPIDLVV